MSSGKQKRRYPEELMQKREYDPHVDRLPMPPHYPHSRTYNNQIKAAKEIQDDEDARMVGLLFTHYVIPVDDPDKWEQLAMRLARDHIPGFQMTKGRSGAKTKWTLENRYQLLMDVKAIIQQNPHMKQRSACLSLAKRRGVNGESLHRRYKEARKEFADLKGD